MVKRAGIELVLLHSEYLF